MEIEAGRLKVESAVLEQAANIRFRVKHESLVLEVQHPARQNRVPMIHQREIATVIAGEVLQMVAEGLALGEILLEGAEACIHRMATRIDHGRVGKDRVNQSDMTEVVGQLVGESVTPAAQRRSLRQVVPAEDCEFG